MIDRCRRLMLTPEASPATVRCGVIVPIRAVLLHAHCRGWCDRPSFEIPREAEGRTRYLLPDQAECLIAAGSPSPADVVGRVARDRHADGRSARTRLAGCRPRRRPGDPTGRSDQGKETAQCNLAAAADHHIG